jgi:hypothetical protein
MEWTIKAGVTSIETLGSGRGRIWRRVIGRVKEMFLTRVEGL